MERFLWLLYFPLAMPSTLSCGMRYASSERFSCIKVPGLSLVHDFIQCRLPIRCRLRCSHEETHRAFWDYFSLDELKNPAMPAMHWDLRTQQIYTYEGRRDVAPDMVSMTSHSFPIS